MAVVTTVTKVAYQMKLNNGVGPSGDIKTVNVSLPAIHKDRADDQKAFNISTAVGRCLSKQIYYLAKVTTSGVEQE